MTATNGQAPFITLYINLMEAAPGRDREDLAMLAAEVFRQREQGLPNELGVPVTNAFPKIVYVLSDLNDNEDSEYWWLTRLAARCTAKRMVPDYVSARKVLQLKKPSWSFREARDGAWKFGTPNPLKELTVAQCDTLQKYYRGEEFHRRCEKDVLDKTLAIVSEVPGSRGRTVKELMDAALCSVAPMGCRNFLP